MNIFLNPDTKIYWIKYFLGWLLILLRDMWLIKQNLGVPHSQGETKKYYRSRVIRFCVRSEPHFTDQLRKKQKSRAGRARDFLLKVRLSSISRNLFIYIYIGITWWGFRKGTLAFPELVINNSQSLIVSWGKGSRNRNSHRILEPNCPPRPVCSSPVDNTGAVRGISRKT